MLYRAGPTGHGLGQAYDDKGPWCALDRGVLKGGGGGGAQDHSRVAPDHGNHMRGPAACDDPGTL